MKAFNRRNFLGTLGAASATPFALLAEPPKPEPFTFLFLTDTHTQPELNAVAGTAMAMKHARAIRADFAIHGGDHGANSDAVPKSRAIQLFDLYGKTEQDLGLKVYHAVGNHDILGIAADSGVPPTDPLYGRKLFEDRFGKTFYSFDRRGVHFIVLDSVDVTADHSFEGRIAPDQIAWLKTDLAALPPRAPVIVVSHIPLATAYPAYYEPPEKQFPFGFFCVVNAWEIFPLFAGHNVLGVLQGHTHVNERLVWQGIPYITSGAVCGNWWHGTHLGTPEGFTVCTVADGKLTTRYETYGFQSVEPDNT
jgi:Icc protein